MASVVGQTSLKALNKGLLRLCRILRIVDPCVRASNLVESLAYRLYEDEGKPEGRADEHWARAEQFIRAERLAIASSSEKSNIIQSVASD
jgi:DUF2934 family protein